MQLTLELLFSSPEINSKQTEDQSIVKEFAQLNSCQTLQSDKIKKPIQYKGGVWTCTASMSAGAERCYERCYVKLYELIRPDDWGEPTHSYNKNLNTSGDGFYTGQLVKYRNEQWVIGAKTVEIRPHSYDLRLRDVQSGG